MERPKSVTVKPQTKNPQTKTVRVQASGKIFHGLGNPTPWIWESALSQSPGNPDSFHILQRGVQWKQGVVICMVLHTTLLYNTAPIHCNPSDCTPLCRVSILSSRIGRGRNSSCYYTYIYIYIYAVVNCLSRAVELQQYRS